MRRLKGTLIAALLLVTACKKGDGLIVVTVTATPRITDVATLHVAMTVGSTTRTHDITNPPSTIDDSGSTSFGIDVSADFGSSITVQVDARDSSGAMVGTGSGSGNVTAGKQATINVALVGGVQGAPDMVALPSSELDFASLQPLDMAFTAADMTMPPSDMTRVWPWGDTSLTDTSAGIIGGVLHVASGDTRTLTNGGVYNLVSLTIEAGGTLQVSPGDSWTIVGTAGDVVVNGSLVASAGQNSGTFNAQAPAPDGSLTGEMLTLTIPAPALGGTGGLGGIATCGDIVSSQLGFPAGGAPVVGNGGGGGGGWLRGLNRSDCSYQCPGSYWNCWTLPVQPNEPGHDATTIGGGGGGGDTANGFVATPGGGASLFGQSGGSSAVVGSYGNTGGGGGGSRGYQGQGIFLFVSGNLTGTGSISADGQRGGNGGNSGNCTPTSYACTAGGGGGGGAGGHGGKIVIRYHGTISILSNQLHASGGAGGLGGIAGSGPMGASQNGFPGTTGTNGVQPDLKQVP